jgi:MFS family permease
MTILKSLFSFSNDLKYLFLAQSLSNIGNYMVTITLSFYIYRLTGSALHVAMIYLVTVLPSLLSISIGPILERVPLKALMISSDIVRALLICVIPFVIQDYLYIVYLLVFSSTILGTIFESSRMTVLVEASKGIDLHRVNSMDQALQLIGSLIGMGLGGLLVSLNFSWAFWINASTFLISAFFVLMIQAGQVPLKIDDKKGYLWREIKEGFRYIAREPILSFNIYGYIIICLGGGAFNSMLVIFALSHLQSNNIGYTFLEVSQLAGLILTAFTMSIIAQKIAVGRMLLVGIMLFGIFIMSLAFIHTLWLAAIVCFFIGCINLIVYVISQSMLMEATQVEHRAKVMNIRVASSKSASTLGALVAGWLIESAQLTISIVIGLSGTLLIIAGLIALWNGKIMIYQMNSEEKVTRSA